LQLLKFVTTYFYELYTVQVILHIVKMEMTSRIY